MLMLQVKRKQKIEKEYTRNKTTKQKCILKEQTQLGLRTTRPSASKTDSRTSSSLLTLTVLGYRLDIPLSVNKAQLLFCLSLNFIIFQSPISKQRVLTPLIESALLVWC